jgi:hypothetical protein
MPECGDGINLGFAAKKRALDDAARARINVPLGDAPAAHDRTESVLTFPWNGRSS